MTLRWIWFLPLLIPVAVGWGASSDSVVARVNGMPISADDLRARLHEYQANWKGDPSPEARAFRERVLNELIEERILLAEAEARKIEIRPEELEAALKSVERDYPGESFEKVLAEKRITYSRWRERMRLKLTLDKVVSDLTKEIPAPSEAAIRDYYRSHEAEFRHPEQVRAAQIVVKTAEDGARILEELKKGKPFEELARAHSFTPEAGQGGDLGFLERGVLPPPLEEAFWKLPAGKQTPVIQTDYGYHVVKVLERRPERTEPLEEARPRILKELTQMEREQKFSAWRREVLSRAKIEKNHALLEQTL